MNTGDMETVGIEPTQGSRHNPGSVAFVIGRRCVTAQEFIAHTERVIAGQSQEAPGA